MGAAFTRFVTLSVRERARTKDILSIGPCQTPTCGFVYEREKAIRAFQAKDFWKITAIFSAGSGKEREKEGEKEEGKEREKKKRKKKEEKKEEILKVLTEQEIFTIKKKPLRSSSG